MKDKLIEYIEHDPIYQDYKNGKLKEPSDFDLFCIEHCEAIEELLNQNNSLRGNIKKYSKKLKNRYKEIKNQEKYITKLNREAQRYFDFFMDESIKNHHLEEKYNKALELLSEYNLPCEIDEFNIKNADYCSMNCSVDEEVYKKCWNLYIEQELEKEVKNENK